MIGSLRSN